MAYKISFLSSGPYGISPDMRIIKNNLLSANPDCDFRFFSKNTSSQNPDEAKAMRNLKVNFCTDSENIICIDPSLPVRNMFDCKPYSRILITVPYDYIFKNLINKPQDKKNSLTNFTHIIYTSPIAKKAVEGAFSTEGTEFTECVSPLAEDICCKKSINQTAKKLTRIYPQIEGKKILSIVRTGSKFNAHTANEFDLGAFMDCLNEEYIIITNADEILKKAHSIKNPQKERILYISTMTSASDLLYISDALITNSSHLVCTFAVKRQPLYHIDYCENHFIDYMNSISSLSFPNQSCEISQQISEGTFDPSVCEELSYPNESHSADIINKLIR